MKYSERVLHVFQEVSDTWKPPTKMSLSEWANEKAHLSAESSADVGRWKSYPYQIGMLDAFTDPSIEILTVMKSARIGYTKMVNWDTGYHIEQEPCSQLIVQPTVEDAGGYSKDEITPMLRDTPCLQGKVSDEKSRDSSNTILKKSYPGGALHLTGANSPRGFRRITVKRVKFDEVDGYPPTAGKEGDQIKLGSKRSETFWDRKIVLGSTPTIKGASRIESSFDKSDKRYRFLPCPYCGEFQTLKWKGIVWPKGEPEKAQYKCEFCEKLIPHSMKRQMDEKGEWRATAPFDGHAGFHIWAGYSYSPNSTWGKLAKEFLDVKGDPELLKTFVNTVLGETWEEAGDRPEWTTLAARCEPYKIMTVPSGGMLLTAGVDTQDNRLAVVVRAWGKDEESWLIYHNELYGDPDHPEVWTQLDEILNHDFRHDSGADLKIVSMSIDTGGHRDEAVKRYCRKRAAQGVVAIKGSSTKNKPIVNPPTLQDVDYKGKKIEKGVQLWSVGTDTAKGIIYSRLNNKIDPERETQPGYYHFPVGTSDEYFEQITAEKLITKFNKGFPVKEWVKTRERNEATDCEVYCYHAALRAGVNRLDFDKLKEQLQGTITKSEPQQPKQRKQKVIRSKWMS